MKPRNKSRGEGAPVVNTPAAGRLLAPVIGYVTRRSARHQADMWNQVLEDDPTHGPDSGYVVRVSDSKDADGTWKLVWIPITDTASEG